MKKIRLLIAMMFCSAVSCLYAQNQINGFVKDATSNEPLKTVRIFIIELNKSSETNNDGAFVLNDIPKGNYKLSVKKEGYNTLLLDYNTDEISAPFQISMLKTSIEMKEVLVSGSRSSLPEKSTIKMDVVDMNTFRQNGNLTVMDALNNVAGVSVISTGPGIARPVIRGLTGNRIATIINNVKLENQQWDMEHTLGINQYGISRIEVIKGPASFLYGSDAMGGVLNFVDEAPAPVNRMVADVTAGFYANTFGSISEVGIKQTKDHSFWGFRVGLNNHSDYYDANDKRVANSRFREITAKTFLGFNYKKSLTLFSYQMNIGYYGIVEPFEDANGKKEEEDHPMEFEKPYHTLQHHIFSAKNTLFLGKSKIISTLSYQYDGRNELEPVDNDDKPFLGFNLHTGNADVKWVHQFNKSVSLTTGLQGGATINTNDGYARLIPNYTQTDMAAYVLNQYSLFNKKLNIDLGLRYDLRNVQSELYGTKDSADYMAAINKNFDNLSSSIGANFEVGKNVFLFANVGMGYRAPNLAELTSNGVRLETQRYEIGNSMFVKETNVAQEFGANYAGSNWGFSASVFSNVISNFIYIVNRGDSLVAKQDGAYKKMPVFQFKQKDATFVGFEAKLEIHPVKINWLNFTTTYSNTSAELSGGQVVPQIPPYKINNEITIKRNVFKPINESYLRVAYNYVWSQDRVFTNEMTTPAYNIINLSVGGNVMLLKQKYMLVLGANNLLNTSYYDHLSRLRQYGLQGMGINIFFTVKVPLQIK